MIGVTIAIIQDRRKKNKENTYPIKLRVTFKRKQKYYPLHKWLSLAEWEKVQSKRPGKKYKALKMIFDQLELRAQEAVQKIHPFSFRPFEKKFVYFEDAPVDVLGCMRNYQGQLEKEGRMGSADCYKCSYNSFSKFIGSLHKKDLAFIDVTPAWLNAYENWMLAQGNSPTTIGIYLRNLRTIINLGIGQGLLDKGLYPFGKRKYQIPAGRNLKKALNLAEIKLIVQVGPLSKSEEKARDLWLFSYLCNGMNMKDICRLKYENIEGNSLTFIRSKTSKTSKQHLQAIRIPLMPEARYILDRWGQKPKRPERYIFGILNKHDKPATELAKVRKTIKMVNKYMKRIGERLGIRIKLTTYTARHSFATILKRSGASIEFISESLGHRDIRTTENYLDSFEDSVKEEFQKKLLDFD